MVIRDYRPSDSRALAELFYHTVHTVNAGDYSKAQLDAWAPEDMDLEQWSRSFAGHRCLVAEKEGVVVGFGDIVPVGCLDRLYVHRDHQREGIASALCERLERELPGDIVTYASLTARGFFVKRGYLAVQERQVERRGVLLTNFRMIKERHGRRI